VRIHSGRMKPGTTLILCYHRVAAGADNAFFLCVHPERFQAHLEQLSRIAQPSTLDDLGEPCSRPRVAVTFDDGYGDNLWNALPVAEKVGFPITIFVTSSQVDGTDGYWWDRMAALLRRRPTGIDHAQLDIAGNPTTVRLGAGLVADCDALRRVFLPLPLSEIERLLADIGDRWNVASSAPPDALPLTSGELEKLASSDCVRIGAHTTDHARLSGRVADEQFATIAGSKQRLETMLGREVPHFAYPFGGAQDFDDNSVQQVRTAGFQTACTTEPGLATTSSDPFRLPRRLVMDWTRARLRAQLLRWQLW
jgi:peptidoglycan/xylan/chitin deacetylase (PgdA/CDA1 family)